MGRIWPLGTIGLVTVSKTLRGGDTLCSDKYGAPERKVVIPQSYPQANVALITVTKSNGRNYLAYHRAFATRGSQILR